uniref:Uncharacterized protein n=1 Tax=Anguilla anguilla TaxID=7936 RepID=A0A0E9RH35_ANGAN
MNANLTKITGGGMKTDRLHCIYCR